MPILIKTKGKTTTDHISPAGLWLAYRGHLDKFSDNMFMGATNAFTGKSARAKNIASGETGQPIAKIARDYRARGIGWVVIGDSELRRGQQPRACRPLAAIARRRGRDCPQLRAHPRVQSEEAGAARADLSRSGGLRSHPRGRSPQLDRVAAMAPGKPLECRVAHSDGTAESLSLDHSYSERQLTWFRAGSALNVFHNPPK